MRQYFALGQCVYSVHRPGVFFVPGRIESPGKENRYGRKNVSFARRGESLRARFSFRSGEPDHPFGYPHAGRGDARAQTGQPSLLHSRKPRRFRPLGPLHVSGIRPEARVYLRRRRGPPAQRNHGDDPRRESRRIYPADRRREPKSADCRASPVHRRADGVFRVRLDQVFRADPETRRRRSGEFQRHRPDALR